jgi:hypothetical protein
MKKFEDPTDEKDELEAKKEETVRKRGELRWKPRTEAYSSMWEKATASMGLMTKVLEKLDKQLDEL